MDDIHKAIVAYNEALYQTYKANGLICLSDDSYTYKGVNVLAINNPAVVMAAKSGLIDRLNEVCDELEIERTVKNPNMMQSEIFIATADIKFRLGTLYLYHPYIVTLADSWGYFKGKRHYHYNQTMEDGRFNRELPIAFECLYKYWQRIGDYLCVFFPELLIKQKGAIYFHLPFQHITSKYPQLAVSENFTWLNNFAELTYPAFNKHRKFFVHYWGYDTRHFNKFLESNANDVDAIKKLDEERKNWMPYLKEQLDLCNDGYLRLMNFLNELEISKNAAGEFEYSLLKPAEVIAVPPQ